MAKKEARKTLTTLTLRDMTETELAVKVKQLNLDIQKKRLEKAVGRLKNMREIFGLRKELARVKTIIKVKSTSKL